jgi:hypothetical protein
MFDPGSDHFLIPDPGSKHFFIPDPTWKVGSWDANLLFSRFVRFQEQRISLSQSQKDPGSQIQGVKKSIGSRIRICNTGTETCTAHLLTVSSVYSVFGQFFCN